MAEASGYALRRLISAYRGYVSPLLGRHCRFYPSCSAYAAQAIARHGVARGGWLAVRRLLRCHPFHPGGVDHVPDVTPRMGSCLRGASPSRSPAEGSCLRGAGPSRSPAEGS
ncbi:MAG: membrane protein insertion efficiency factor YidD [Gammaproteobacteria bacterium]|nr:membrane protein insertion efficiency factor YidD [Gammaproteobacteria bacterium]